MCPGSPDINFIDRFLDQFGIDLFSTSKLSNYEWIWEWNLIVEVLGTHPDGSYNVHQVMSKLITTFPDNDFIFATASIHLDYIRSIEAFSLT